MPPKTTQRIPRHVAVIMDGNGRWAEAQRKVRAEGYHAGTETVIKVVRYAFRTGVKFLTLYAFSSENWNRPKDEISALFEILLKFLDKYENEFVENKICLRTIGDLSAFPQHIQDAIGRVKERTKNFSEHVVVVALNYGSRTEILRAVQKFSATTNTTGRDATAIPSWEDFSRHLDTAGIPDPDLIVRTSGEFRLSNFLMLQGAYAELYFTDVLWPDFSEKDWDAALEFYAARERRFGKTSAQIRSETPSN